MIRAKLRRKPVICQKLAQFMWKNDIYLRGLKVSSLACNCVFYRPENRKGNPMVLTFKVFEMQKWNKPTHRGQKVGEKNMVMCLVIMFTTRVMVIKMSKIAQFLYFLLMIAENQLQFRQNIYVHLKNIFGSCTKWYGSLDSQLPLARSKPLKRQDFGIYCWLSSFWTFLPSVSGERQLQNLLTIPF